MPTRHVVQIRRSQRNRSVSRRIINNIRTTKAIAARTQFVSIQTLELNLVAHCETDHWDRTVDTCRLDRLGKGPNTPSTPSTPNRPVGAVLHTATAQGTIGDMSVRAGQGIGGWQVEVQLPGVGHCSGHKLETAGSWAPCYDCSSVSIN